jgi:hypothetical protein
MDRSSLRNKPLLAALLGIAVTGLGHLYLRRWLRALGWMGATVAASALLIPDTTRSAISPGTLNNSLMIFPVILISAVSALDAYLIARAKQLAARNKWIGTNEDITTQAFGTEKDGTTATCPGCGKSVDPDLSFCHWCTTEFESVDDTEV